MSSSITKLPTELLSEITRNVTSQKDLCQLRSVNSIFNSLATPAVFSSITVYSQKRSAEEFFRLIHTAPHIARHVQSIKYVESMGDFDTDDSESYEVARDLKLAFSALHRASSLKMLSLYFSVYYTGKHCTGNAYSHKWAIIDALGVLVNMKHAPKLQSLKLFGWLDIRKSISLFEEAHLARFTASLRHLSFSLPDDVNGIEDSESRELFWKDVVFFETSQLATYPRLAALSLKGIVWEDGTIGQGGIFVPPPLEDFIVRHGKTLKVLKLSGCSINVKEHGRVLPLCYWADVYRRLANALTELVELEVILDEVPYLSSTGPPNEFFLPYPYHRLKRLDGMERDEEALGEFKAVVKKRAMNIDLDFDPEAEGWSGWDEKSDEEY